jgi:hypothetical protein
MHFFKFVFAFISVGGATYAFIKLNEAPAWLKAVSLLMAVSAFIFALPELPRAIEAVKESGQKIVAMLPPLPSAPIAQARSTPTYSSPPIYEPPTIAYSPPKTYDPPAQTYTPPQTTYAPPAKCVAVVLATGGGFGLSAGTQTCNEILERARNNCNSQVSGCGNYATSFDWVAGVHCIERTGNGRRWNSFAGQGSTEDAAFEHARALAANKGFGRVTCMRRVSMSSAMSVANRY